MPIKTKTAILAGVQERRSDTDRRRHSLKTLTYCGLSRRGRREHTRRCKDNYYLDKYSTGLLLMSVLLLSLSCLDAFFTLQLLNQGAYEANPLMAYLLNKDITLFVACKVAVTTIGTLILAMHAYFHVFRFLNGKQLMGLMIGVYSSLVQ